MTRKEAIEEMIKIRKIVKNWNAKDPWHEAVYDRDAAIFNYAFCVNCRDKDPGPWEMPPIPEGMEP